MSSRDLRELSRVRRELRSLLLCERRHGVAESLEKLRVVVSASKNDVPALVNEYERWCMRFELVLA